MSRKILLDAACFLLILLFSYAAVSKLLDYERFRLQLGKSPFISSYAGQLSWALPLSEIVITLFLLVNATKLLGLYGSLFILTVFTLYIAFLLKFSSYIPCSCGGLLGFLSWKQHLVFNIVFIFISITGIVSWAKSKLLTARTSK
jgi:hypothetical protein